MCGNVPCDGIMAVERCVGCFVILACSRDVGVGEVLVGNLLK